MTTAAVEIRRATTTDQPAIVRFAHAVVHDTYDRLVDVGYANDLLHDWWGAALHDDVVAGLVYVAVADHEVVGLTHLGWWHDEPTMWKLYVAADRRGNGIGRDLIDAIIRSLPLGTPRLLTEHIAANVDAERFYIREGFVRTGVDEDTEDPRTWTVWRAKDLPTPDDASWAGYIAQMECVAAVESSRDAEIALWLAEQPAARIADLGAGIGSMTVCLAHAFPAADVTAFDGSTAMVEATTGWSRRSGRSARCALWGLATSAPIARRAGPAARD